MTVKRRLLDWICPAKTFSDPDCAFESMTSLAGSESLWCTYSVMRSHFLFSALDDVRRHRLVPCIVAAWLHNLCDTLWQCYETPFGMKDAPCQAFYRSFFISFSNHLIRLLLLLNLGALARGSRSNQIAGPRSTGPGGIAASQLQAQHWPRAIPGNQSLSPSCPFQSWPIQRVPSSSDQHSISSSLLV